MKYHASFVGRLLGAIGIFYRCNVVVEGNDEEDARLNLSKTHEHISMLSLQELDEEKDASMLSPEGR
jgi:hypothetical protein